MQTNQFFSFIPEKVQLCNYAAVVGHIGMQIFNFVVLSVIIASHNVLTPHFSKTYLPIVLLNERELWVDAQKTSQRKGWPAPSVPAWEVEAQIPPQGLKIH